MFELIESCSEQREGSDWTGKAISLAIHLFLVSAAVAATRGVVAMTDPPLQDTTVYWVNHPSIVAQPPIVLAGGYPAPGPLINPSLPAIDVPTSILPPDPLSGWTVAGSDPPPGPGLQFVPGPGTVVSVTTVVDARLADEPPELLTHPTPRYPEVLRQAGIDGRVMVEAVLDSLGRAEAGSLRIVSSPHPLFDGEAEAVVAGSRYRPGRVGGRAVRVRVLVPVTFQIRR